MTLSLTYVHILTQQSNINSCVPIPLPPPQILKSMALRYNTRSHLVYDIHAARHRQPWGDSATIYIFMRDGMGCVRRCRHISFRIGVRRPSCCGYRERGSTPDGRYCLRGMGNFSCFLTAAPSCQCHPVFLLSPLLLAVAPPPEYLRTPVLGGAPLTTTHLLNSPLSSIGLPYRSPSITTIERVSSRFLT